MTHRPDFHHLSRASNRALDDLNEFRAQHPPLVTTMPPNHVPSALLTSPAASSVSERSSTTAGIPQFDSSRLFIPPTAYARGNASYSQHPSTGQMSKMTPQPPNPRLYVPRIYREPLTCITREMVFDRVYLLLRDNLDKWWTENPEALFHITNRVTDDIIRRGQSGGFGPNGLSSLIQIIVAIGHEGIHHYMCLAVHPCSGCVQILLKGDLCEQEGRDPIFDYNIPALCREGFDRAASRLYADIVSRTSRKYFGK